jgi:phage FluMu protein Com
MTIKCKSCLEKTEFLEFTEEIKCENCGEINKYEKEDIRITVSKSVTFKHKIYNKHRYMNFKNFVFSFLIIICSSIIALMDLDTTLNIIFLVIIILSSLLMLTKNNIINYESSDPNIKKDIVFDR